jgi:hypothetical protein
LLGINNQFIKIKKEELLTPFFMPLTFAIQQIILQQKNLKETCIGK